MDQGFAIVPSPARRTEFLANLAAVMPRIAALAVARDAEAAFPSEEVALLAGAGALIAPLPGALGGLGIGTEEDAAQEALALLRLIGAASLPLGRLFEGHLNALRLICRYGGAAQRAAAAEDARAGHLFAVWNADPADAPLTLVDGVLRGAKIFASGAGYATRALVTAGYPKTMLLIPLVPGERADLAGWTAQGMRATATGRVSFDGLAAGPARHIGKPGDYEIQPEFFGGAWRASAVALGGLDALVAALRDGLVARNRHGNAHQLTRLGLALIARETASLWMRRVAAMAEAAERDAAEVVAYVNLARIAVETACLDAMRLAQRGIGLTAFLRPDPIERICRDLGTYLRQPCPDEALTDAAAHFAASGALPA